MASNIFRVHGFQYSCLVFYFIILVTIAPACGKESATSENVTASEVSPKKRLPEEDTVTVKAKDVTQKLLSLFLKKPYAIINATMPTLGKKPSLLNSLFGHNLNATRDTPKHDNNTSLVNETNVTTNNSSDISLAKTTNNTKQNADEKNSTKTETKTASAKNSTHVKKAKAKNSTDVKNVPTKNQSNVKKAAAKNTTDVKNTLTKNSTLVEKPTTKKSTKDLTDTSQKRTPSNTTTKLPFFHVYIFPKVPTASASREIAGKTALTLCTDGTKSDECRTVVTNPHTSTSKFQGSIGISETGMKGKTKELGGEEMSAFNETVNFKIGNNKTSYNFQNLTDLHNCSGCLKGKHLIKHNETYPVQENEKNASNKTKDGKKLTPAINLKEKGADMGKNKSLEDTQQFVKNSTGYFKSKDKLNITPVSDSNKNNTSSAISTPSDNLKNRSSKLNETFDWENKLFRRHCDPVKISSHELDQQMFSRQRNNSITGLYINCITKRRLVSNKVTHTKTKKDGKVVSDTTRDENEDKKKKNDERARANQDRAKANEERVHQSEENDRSNKEKAVANDKVLQEILRGDHGKPAAEITEDENRNYENLTAKLDPSMIPDNRVDPPPEDRKDEDVGMIGMDPRPAIEEQKSTKNKTNETHQQQQQNKNETKTTAKVDDKGENAGKENLKNSTNSKHRDDKTNNNVITTSQNADNSTKTNDKKPVDNYFDSDDDFDKPSRSILAFGDSVTKGLYGVNRYNPYTMRLQQLLQEDSNKNNDKKKETFAIYNEGVSGECACGEMTKRLPMTLDRYSDQKKKIDLVIILGGTNDLLKSDCGRKCDVFESIKKLHKAVHDRGMKSVVVTILKVTIADGDGKQITDLSDKDYEDTLWEINQELRGFAKEDSQKMTLCDLADEFPRKAAISIDKIHPTKEGYDKIAEIVFDCIKDFKY